MTATKKPRSWRVCPQCKSRATKLFSLNTGLYQCQLCSCEYDPHAHEQLQGSGSSHVWIDDEQGDIEHLVEGPPGRFIAS